MTSTLRQAALLVALLAAGPALAHTDAGDIGGFQTGFLHPLFGLDHVIAMIAVGLWGVFLGAPAIWVLPIVFPLVMALGGALPAARRRPVSYRAECGLSLRCGPAGEGRRRGRSLGQWQLPPE